MPSRRDTLKHGTILLGLLAGSGFFPLYAQVISKAAFEAKSLNDVFKAMGTAAPQESKEITLIAPDVAEDGASVQITLSTTLPGVKQLLILAEKNPSALVGVFNITENIEPAMTTRIKMAQTSNVYAVAVLLNGRTVFAKKEITVTLGGCG